MAFAIGIAWLVFIYLGVPIAFVLGASAMVGVLLAPDGLDLLPALVEQMFIAVSSFNFLAIPPPRFSVLDVETARHNILLYRQFCELTCQDEAKTCNE